MSVSGSSAALTCSFAGGCLYEVTAAGLSSILAANSTANHIKVCDNVCAFSASDSSATVAKCKLPKLSTLYSDSNFNISTVSEDLRSGVPFGTLTNNSAAFDNVLVVNVTEGAQVNGSCHIGMAYKAGHVGMLHQVKWFIGEIWDKTIYAGEVKFQGSSDGTTYTDLFTMDENVHEGWNYHNWESSATYPKYRYYRFYGTKAGSCVINEIKVTGVETVDNNDANKACSPVLTVGATVTDLSSNGQVTYQSAQTALLTSISPRYGSVEGGDTVTFTGTGFSTTISDYKITLDGIACPVSAATTTSVTCQTGPRPGLVASSTEIYINGKGLVATQGKLFRYVSMWSADSTWGGEFAPMDGESVSIPKGLNLLVDVDSTPKLNAVVVEGSLIFAPHPSDANHERFFDAHYIFVSGGYMEVGTEEYPYTSKLTITMHGNVSSPYLPIYGNKVLAVRFGTLDMHGVTRTPSWTVLETTANALSTQITLATAVDWAAGEEVAIASTSYNGREGEKRTIVSVDRTNPGKPILTLDEPLNFKHFAAIETFGGESIDMRAEVGLLTRNVKFRGDPETSYETEYGATIFLHSHGDDSVVARLSNIELTDVGQGFKIGRYAVHFHMIGAVHNSYAKGNSVHQGFNRAFTLHGTNYLRLMNNVAYEVKGHNIFIEDAVERKNYMYQNLVMKVLRSWSGLNTDQTPAGFWITHPDNNFIENHVGGSDRYAYWYDL